MYRVRSMTKILKLTNVQLLENLIICVNKSHFTIKDRDKNCKQILQLYVACNLSQ